METLIALPIIIPLTTAVVCVLFWHARLIQMVISLVGATGLLLASISLMGAVRREGVLVSQMGGWPAPFGITLVCDMFSALMVLVTGIIGLTVAVYAVANVDARRKSFGFWPLYHLLLVGVCGAFLTGDMFNLYVWFEVMLIASFVLMALGSERAQMEGAIKYVTLNLLSSAFFLAGVAILYGLAGSLNMADLAVRLAQAEENGLVAASAMLFLVAFGIKAAVFPLFFWLPASYHTPTVAISAIFSGLLTKVGVYAIIRVFTLMFVQDVGYTHTIILAISALTMIVGVLGAVAQNEVRRILSFHIISQIGYMILGLGLFTVAGLAGSIFYIFHHIIVKTNLFLASGVIQRLTGDGHLKRVGGLYRAYPALAIIFMVPAMSLAGMPPLSGFFAKLALIQAGLSVHQYLIVGIALLVGLLTLFSMTKIWGEAFWREQDSGAEQSPQAAMSGGESLLYYAPMVVLAAITLVLGFGAQLLLTLSFEAAEQLMNPAIYVRAVMGGR